MKYTRSPLAPKAFPKMPQVAGVRLATCHAGIRKNKSRNDAMLAVCDAGTVIAGVLTKSLTASASVLACRTGLKHGKARAILVNAGNSNAFTGKAGEAFMKSAVAAVAGGVKCPPREVFSSSTGVIGVPMPADLLAKAVPGLVHGLGGASWEDAAWAIATTDTFAKGSVAKATIDGKKVTICGIAKGSGMIAPDMATMLAYVFTDAAIEQKALQAMVSAVNERTFNSITVDGDTSTSDTLLVAATGRAGNKAIKSAADKRGAGFAKALEAVLRDLALQIVRDGEGATKFVTIKIAGAASDSAARKIALSIANSPLVKTAIAGEDANWGRIVMAIGKAGEKADRDKIKIRIGGVLICAHGLQVPGYDEAPVAAHMRGQDVNIDVALGIGKGTATVWTCDLTHGYISINADYRS
ncbi:MAG: bifunctional glutamate N-acetyltransferase/amino-acid acetyltransferase ArgJ [Alphaproteobacteria bacterium]|nr:bifunctional glutamate N-acetyltransferase/amino-acid acetyltransferase ArgJ [Alphaproteobacteria bacterium]